MQVHVTQQHIDEGTQGTPRDCAIARALRDMGIHALVWYKDGQGVAMMSAQEFTLGQEGGEFIKNFDKDKSLVKPTILTLSPYFPHMQFNNGMYTYAHMPSAMVMDEGSAPNMPMTATQVQMGSQWYLKDFPQPKAYHADFGYYKSVGSMGGV